MKTGSQTKHAVVAVCLFATAAARVDEVGIWERLLTSQERADLYNSGNGNTDTR